MNGDARNRVRFPPSPLGEGQRDLAALLPSRSGVGVFLPRWFAWKENPHPNPSPEEEGLESIPHRNTV